MVKVTIAMPLYYYYGKIYNAHVIVSEAMFTSVVDNFHSGWAV